MSSLLPSARVKSTGAQAPNQYVPQGFNPFTLTAILPRLQDMQRVWMISLLGWLTCLNPHRGMGQTNVPNAETPDWLSRAIAVVPSPRQLAWQNLEFGGMIHFGVNTFTDREWGDGKEDPRWFNPANLDAREWIRIFKSAGMRYVVLTAKHHDGFCLWPSSFTEHSVKNSPWRDGKGDLVREVADACRAEGLKFGIYLSPADLHEPSFGTPAYINHFTNQLRELLTQYGEITEVWFDDANPSPKPAKYDFIAWRDLVRELQPNAVIFGRGPDVRWVGNEGGAPRASEWSVVPIPVPLDQFTGGNMMSEDLGSRVKVQHAPHLAWWPAEAAVSIRPGWFYHPSENARIRSPQQLFSLYLNLVGRNTVLLLNVPPDRTGRLHPTDAQTLRALGKQIDNTFAVNLAQGALVTASSTQKDHPQVSTQGLIDDLSETYWATEPGVTQAELVLTLPKPENISIIEIMERIESGQRIERFRVDIEQEGRWISTATGTTIGHRAFIQGREPKPTTRVRLRILESRGPPALASVLLR